jgi:hypothetical protein
MLLSYVGTVLYVVPGAATTGKNTLCYLDHPFANWRLSGFDLIALASYPLLLLTHCLPTTINKSQRCPVLILSLIASHPSNLSWASGCLRRLSYITAVHFESTISWQLLWPDIWVLVRLRHHHLACPMISDSCGSHSGAGNLQKLVVPGITM